MFVSVTAKRQLGEKLVGVVTIYFQCLWHTLVGRRTVIRSVLMNHKIL